MIRHKIFIILFMTFFSVNLYSEVIIDPSEVISELQYKELVTKLDRLKDQSLGPQADGNEYLKRLEEKLGVKVLYIPGVIYEYQLIAYITKIFSDIVTENSNEDNVRKYFKLFPFANYEDSASSGIEMPVLFNSWFYKSLGAEYYPEKYYLFRKEFDSFLYDNLLVSVAGLKKKIAGFRKNFEPVMMLTQAKYYENHYINTVDSFPKIAP